MIRKKSAVIEIETLALAAINVRTVDDWNKISRSLGNQRSPESCMQAAISKLKWEVPVEESNKQDENICENDVVTARMGTVAHRVQTNQITRSQQFKYDRNNIFFKKFMYYREQQDRYVHHLLQNKSIAPNSTRFGNSTFFNSTYIRKKNNYESFARQLDDLKNERVRRKRNEYDSELSSIDDMDEEMQAYPLIVGNDGGTASVAMVLPAVVYIVISRLKHYRRTRYDREGWIIYTCILSISTSNYLLKISMGLQTLVQAVATFADPKPDPEKGGKEFVQMMQEIGGLHRAILPHLLPDNFELLFKLLPEVIVDVVSARRKDGPLTSHDRSRLLAVWCSICDLMSSHFSQGWERCVIPKSDKFNKAYRFDKTNSMSNIVTSNPLLLIKESGMRRESATCSIAASHRTNRSRTQDEVMPWQLSRGHSAPLGIHEVDLQVDSARQPPL
uniref:Rab-GAP TBC domain-containing protein n=1 Tax=Heterorhabditis bacteriophora TaxID=37862 RepID=A0A1I7XCA6_HETBA